MSTPLDDLTLAIEAQERAEERLAKAAHALAEAEEAAEDDPDSVAAVERCLKQYAAAEAAVGFARGRRRELEAQLDPAEVVGVHAILAVGR